MQLLQRIRDVSDGELDLPQICVVGDQSAGKSALLTCITGIDFPVEQGICTKAPIVVQCNYDETLPEPVFEIQNQATKGYENVDIGELASKIHAIQNGTCSKSKISLQEICVRVRGRDQMDIVIIDLPGIINAGEGKEDTHNLIRRYIKVKQTLILLVSEAKQDVELTGALDLAKRFDPGLARTLRVLTKFDIFDSKEAKDTAVALIRSEASSTLGVHAVVCRVEGGREYNLSAESKVLSNAQVPLERAGVKGLKDRLPPIYAKLIRSNLPGLKVSIETKLSVAETQLERLGHAPLGQIAMIIECQTALKTKFSAFEQEITPLMKRFQEAIHATEGRITMTWVKSNLKENAFRCPFFQGEDAFLTCLKEMTAMWNPHVGKLINDLEQRLLSSIQYIQTDTSGVSKLLSECIQDKWNVHSKALVATFRRACEATLKEEIEFGTMNHYLIDKYAEEMLLPQKFLEDFMHDLNWDDLHKPTQHSETSLKQTQTGPTYEGPFELKEGSLVSFKSHGKGGGFPDAGIYTGTIKHRSVQADHWKVHFDSLHTARCIPAQDLIIPTTTHAIDWKQNLKAELDIKKQEWVSRYKSQTLHEHLEQRVFAAIKATWAVEKKTFTDMVLKKCRDSIIKERGRWVEMVLLTDMEIRDAAVEDECVQVEREQLNKTITAMKENLKYIDLMMPAPLLEFAHRTESSVSVEEEKKQEEEPYAEASKGEDE